MSNTEFELQSAITDNHNRPPRKASVADAEEEWQKGAQVVISDVLGDFCEQTGAQFG